jgi:predicted MPP superfamily phosphohydrolase
MRIRKERIVIPSLTEKLASYAILHVSDIHFNEKVEKNTALRKWLRTIEPDLILITGDFITHDKYIESLCEFLVDLKSKDGVYGILGNHDYYYRTLWQHIRHSFLRKEYRPNDWKRLVRSLERLGITMLINEQVAIQSSGGSQIFIEGTDDPVLGKPKISDSTPQFLSSDLKILMSHSPDILYSEELQKKKFDLLLSGHTHGGQIRFPGIGPLLTGTEHASRREAYGAYKSLGGLSVNVSSGIGYSLLPIRINCPAEVILIELANS